MIYKKLYLKLNLYYNYIKMKTCRDRNTEGQVKHGLRLFMGTRLRFSPGFWKGLNAAARGLSRHPWGNIGQKNLPPVRSCSTLPTGGNVCEANFPHRHKSRLPVRFNGSWRKTPGDEPHCLHKSKIKFWQLPESYK